METWGFSDVEMTYLLRKDILDSEKTAVRTTRRVQGAQQDGSYKSQRDRFYGDTA